MNISARPRRATLSFCAGGERNSSSLRIDCIASDGAGVLEIGKRHVFASRKNRKLLSRRRSCDLEVWIILRSSLSEEAVQKLNLSQDKIGELTFVPPSPKTALYSASRACLGASLFLNDSEYESLVAAFLSGKRPRSLALELEWDPGKGPLRYGWEPDGSRIEWKVDELAEPISVGVAELTIGIDLFQ